MKTIIQHTRLCSQNNRLYIFFWDLFWVGTILFFLLDRIQMLHDESRYESKHYILNKY